jgi:hypothetical protein
LDSAYRKSEPIGPRAAEPDGGLEEAANEEVRVTGSPARVLESADRSRTARTARVLDSADRANGARVTSSPARAGYPAGAMSQTTTDQVVWAPSVWPITDAMSIAAVAVNLHGFPHWGLAQKCNLVHEQGRTMKGHLPGHREAGFDHPQRKTTHSEIVRSGPGAEEPLEEPAMVDMLTPRVQGARGYISRTSSDTSRVGTRHPVTTGHDYPPSIRLST